MSGGRTDLEEFELWVSEITAQRLSLPPSQQLKFLKESVQSADPRWKRAATILFFSTCEVMGREDKQFEKHRELRYFYLGVVGLIVCVAIAIFANLNRNGVYVLQLVAGLSAAALLAYMPGMLEVDLKLKEAGSFWGGKLRGTSAGAAFIIVWLVLPSLVQTKSFEK